MKMYLQETGRKSVDWIRFIEDRDKLMDQEMNCRVIRNTGNLLTNSGTVCFSEGLC